MGLCTVENRKRRPYKTIIVPRGIINPDENNIIEIPLSLDANSSLVVKAPNDTSPCFTVEPYVGDPNKVSPYTTGNNKNISAQTASYPASAISNLVPLSVGLPFAETSAPAIRSGNIKTETSVSQPDTGRAQVIGNQPNTCRQSIVCDHQPNICRQSVICEPPNTSLQPIICEQPTTCRQPIICEQPTTCRQPIICEQPNTCVQPTTCTQPASYIQRAPLVNQACARPKSKVDFTCQASPSCVNIQHLSCQAQPTFRQPTYQSTGCQPTYQCQPRPSLSTFCPQPTQEAHSPMCPICAKPSCKYFFSNRPSYNTRSNFPTSFNTNLPQSYKSYSPPCAPRDLFSIGSRDKFENEMLNKLLNEKIEKILKPVLFSLAKYSPEDEETEIDQRFFGNAPCAPKYSCSSIMSKNSREQFGYSRTSDPQYPSYEEFKRYLESSEPSSPRRPYRGYFGRNDAERSRRPSSADRDTPRDSFNCPPIASCQRRGNVSFGETKRRNDDDGSLEEDAMTATDDTFNFAFRDTLPMGRRKSFKE